MDQVGNDGPEATRLAIELRDEFERGLAKGREWARRTVQRFAAWVEENPGTAVLVALGAGLVTGMLLFPKGAPKDDRRHR